MTHTPTTASTSNPLSPAAGHGPRAESLAGGIALMLALTVIQRGIGFLRGVLFCRQLDPAELGQWDLAFNFLMFAAPLAVLGLPGSFGRYVDYFRQRGDLRGFLLRVAAATSILGGGAVALLAVAHESAARWVFGAADRPERMLLLAVTLGAVIGMNFILSLFTALRQYRAVSRWQFWHSLSFATLGILLVTGWQPRVESVVLAFAGASSLVALWGVVVLRQVLADLPQTSIRLPQRDVWARLAPFAFWLWVTNWVCNSFELVDRLVIVHLSGLEETFALGQVGQYHTARLLPLLLVGVADLVSHMLTPHLSAAWEAGQRRRVERKLNLVLKLTAIGFCLAAVGVLWGSPLLFDWALRRKFETGASLLGWTLAAAVWTALATIAFNYLWCLERSRWVSLSLAAGLAFNLVLSWSWIGPWGLAGVAAGSAIGRGVTWGVVVVICWALGFRWDRGLVVLGAVPILLPLGGVVTLSALAACLASPSLRCFTPRELRSLGEMAEQRLRPWRGLLTSRSRIPSAG